MGFRRSGRLIGVREAARAALRRPGVLPLIAIALLGGGLRAARAADGPQHRLVADERSYKQLAIDLSENGHYGDPTTRFRSPLRWPPGAPVMFAVGHKLAPSNDVPGAYWLQALAGTLLIVVVFALGLALGGPIAGVVAAGITAFYGPQIALSGSLLSEGLGSLLLAAAVLAAVHALRRPRPLAVIAAGVLFGATILTRTDLLFAPLLVAAVLAVVIARRERLAAGARAALILLAAAAVTLAPWVIYASERAGHFVAVTEGDAAALFVGTYLPGDGRTTGMKLALGRQVKRAHPNLRGIPSARLPAAVALDFVAARHPQLPRDAAIRREARANLRRYLLGDPLAFARMAAAKASRMWLLSSRVGSPTVSHVTRVWHVILVIGCLLLAVVALIRLRDAGIGLIFAVLASVTLLHAVTVAKPRYNLPQVPLVAAAGCASAVNLVRRRPREGADAARPSGGARAAH